MKSVSFPNGPIKVAGNLHLPKDFSTDRSYVAIVVVHPAGGVKEQTAGFYGSKLADEGMVALAYDASCQGESGGEPRQEEYPYARVEDVRAAVDYLTTLEFVEGMSFDKGYISPYFVTTENMTAEFENALILIHEKKLANVRDMLPLLEKVAQDAQRRPLVIIA